MLSSVKRTGLDPFSQQGSHVDKKKKTEPLLEKIMAAFAANQEYNIAKYRQAGSNQIAGFLFRLQGKRKSNPYLKIDVPDLFGYSSAINIENDHFVFRVRSGVGTFKTGWKVAGLIVKEELHKKIFFQKTFQEKGGIYFLPLTTVDGQSVVVRISKELACQLPKLFQIADSPDQSNVEFGNSWISNDRLLIQFQASKELQSGTVLCISPHLLPTFPENPVSISENVQDDDIESVTSLSERPYTVADRINQIFCDRIRDFDLGETDSKIISRFSYILKNKIKDKEKSVPLISEEGFYSNGNLEKQKLDTVKVVFKKGVKVKYQTNFVLIRDLGHLLRKEEIVGNTWYLCVNAGKSGEFFIKVSDAFYELFVETSKEEANTDFFSFAVKKQDKVRVSLIFLSIPLVQRGSIVSIEKGVFQRNSPNAQNLASDGKEEKATPSDFAAQREEEGAIPGDSADQLQENADTSWFNENDQNLWEKWREGTFFPFSKT